MAFVSTLAAVRFVFHYLIYIEAYLTVGPPGKKLCIEDAHDVERE